MTAGNVPASFEQSINIFDSQGASRPMKLSFVKTGPDAWAYEVAYQGPNADVGGPGGNPVTTGNLTFNADGTLATPASGLNNFTVPCAGSIVSNSLESSTSDLAREFSSLITTQRAYSAATRIVTTADQMLQELMQIKQ